MTVNSDLSLDERLNAEKATQYRSIVGQLMWICKRTRPDICYAVGVLARHSQAPTQAAFNAAIRVVKYLKGTRTHGIVVGMCFTKLGASKQPFVNYADSAFGDELPTAKSTGGYASLIWNTLIDWSSKLQPEVAGSTFHAELIQLDIGVKSCLWQQKLTDQLSFFDQREQHATPILIDNSSVISFAHGTVTSRRIRHINTKYNSIRNHIASGDVYLRYIESKQNLADIFTKPLGLEPHSRLTRALNVLSLEEAMSMGELILDEVEYIPGVNATLTAASALVNNLTPTPRANLTIYNKYHDGEFYPNPLDTPGATTYDIDTDTVAPIASTSASASSNNGWTPPNESWDD